MKESTNLNLLCIIKIYICAKHDIYANFYRFIENYIIAQLGITIVFYF